MKKLQKMNFNEFRLTSLREILNKKTNTYNYNTNFTIEADFLPL